PAFDHHKLSQALGKILGKGIQPERLPIDNLAFDAAAKQVSFAAAGKRWDCKLTDYELRATGKDVAAVRSIPVLDGPRPSRRDGVRHSYGKLAPGAANGQHTHDGHAWVVVGNSGRTVAAFMADAQGGQAVIDGTWRPRNNAPLLGRLFGRSDRDSPDGKWSV